MLAVTARGHSCSLVPVDAVGLVGLHGSVVAERAEEVVAPAARALLAAHRGPLLAAEVAHLQREGVHQVNVTGSYSKS